MHGITRDNTLRLVEVVSTRVQIAIEAWEVAARDLDTNAMSGFEVIARHHWSERYFVNLTLFHPHLRLVVTVAITHALNRLVEVVRTTIRIDIDQFHLEVI